MPRYEDGDMTMAIPKISVEEMETKYVAREANSEGSDLAFLDQ